MQILVCGLKGTVKLEQKFERKYFNVCNHFIPETHTGETAFKSSQIYVITVNCI